MAEEFRVCEFFSGIGGWSQALASAGKELQKLQVQAFDINTVSNAVYAHNYGKSPCPRTIEALQAADVSAQLWMMSPPCQPHTRNNQTATRDLQDPRSQSFLHLIELLRTMETPPTHIALENVVGFEGSDCCALWRDVMRERGYSMLEFHLTPSQFGIPNERPRYYSLSYRGRFANGVEGVSGDILTSIPHLEEPALSRPLSEYIMPLAAEEVQSLLIGRDVLTKQSSWCIDIATVDDTSTACFTKSYSRYHKGTGSVLLMPAELAHAVTVEHEHGDAKTEEEEERKVPSNDTEEQPSTRLKRALAADSGTEPACKKQGLLEDPSAREFDPTWHTKYEGRLRYFSPRELLNLFGFHAQFAFPETCPRKKQYEMIGNSLNAVVASKLLQFLFA